MRSQEEFKIQCAVANHLRWQYPKALWTIAPSGIQLPPHIGAKYKSMGYRVGTPDLIISESRHEYHGMFLEIKTTTGKLSNEQKDFLIQANLRGYKAVCCMGYNAAIKAIDEYLMDRKVKCSDIFVI